MRRMVVVLVALALVVGLIGLPPAPVAEAGSNGQQIVLYVSGGGYPRISWVKVTGKNQYGQTVSKSFSYNPATDWAWMSGWWWKGVVDVQWKMSDGRSNSCYYSVPTSQQGDWVYLQANRGPGLC